MGPKSTRSTVLSAEEEAMVKTLRGLTPYEAICKPWSGEPDRFRLDPVHWTSGLNS
jgi:hypothetical protein|tara:strand:+ start:324 stop:491 length:168 start_codon:yes stop_codon:yes gene_type:complete